MTATALANTIREAPPAYEAAHDLRALLKRHFGYDSFRRPQEEIISDSLAARDVLALLPTGAGKSLCFQLPALALSGVTVVVSPLIALMKDQVDALRRRGIPAVAVNSSLAYQEIQERLRGVAAGDYRLVYVAPERLMQPEFLQTLARTDLSLVAIDEAHCISQWGHDFRPEYRRLAELRTHFPSVPFMALTATATERVRSDIIEQLRLHEPAVHVASFNRPNLRYWVRPKQDTYKQLRDFVRKLPGQPGIVYCHTRKMSESVAARLNRDGVKAVAYHAGMTAADRQRNQDLFVQDRVQVVCATIAFGMGIDKPNVRFVAHYDVPKNIEAYYQETGRAGRDGQTSWCVLFFSRGDATRHEIYAEEHDDPQIRAVALQQIDEMVSFAESKGCRRKRMLAYFGETFGEPGCGDGCDNCHEAQRKRPALGRNRGEARGFDRRLFERLRVLRKKIAEERGAPAFTIFADRTLREMARAYPQDDESFLSVKGIGPQKLAEHGAQFLREIKAHVAANDREGAVVTPEPEGLSPTHYETVTRYLNGESVDDIARARDLQPTTVISHLASAIKAGEPLDVEPLFPSGAREEIAQAFHQAGGERTKPVFELLNGRYSYGLLRLYLATREREGRGQPVNGCEAD